MLEHKWYESLPIYKTKRKSQVTSKSQCQQSLRYSSATSSSCMPCHWFTIDYLICILVSALGNSVLSSTRNKAIQICCR